VEDPPTDLDEVVVALGPQGRSKDPTGSLGRFLQFVTPMMMMMFIGAETLVTQLVSHVPDGGDYVRTNPVHVRSTP
jgi:hypothetical protein